MIRKEILRCDKVRDLDELRDLLVEYSSTWNPVCFDGGDEMRLQLIRSTLSDGSKVYDLRVEMVEHEVNKLKMHWKGSLWVVEYKDWDSKPATVWLATDKADFVRKSDSAFSGHETGVDPHANADKAFEQYIKYMQSCGLSFSIMDIEEAWAWVDSVQIGHDELRDLMITYGAWQVMA